MHMMKIGLALMTLPVMAATYTIDSVQQRYPWNGKVDVTYTVSGGETLNPSQAWLTLEVTDRKTGETFRAQSLGGPLPSASGQHHVVWNAADDGRTTVSDELTAKIVKVTMPEKYVVIDLSGGFYAPRFPVSYLDAPPEGGVNTPEYKTTKLVLRYLPAGSFIMGSPYDETGREATETQHPVTLTHPFYFALFDLTRGPFERIMGHSALNEKGHGEMRPMDEYHSTNLRGEGQGVTSYKLLGLLSAKTGLSFEWPTDAQWEYACRAGTTTARYTGVQTDADLSTIARWKTSSAADKAKHTDYHTDVGSYAPNPWGLYDLYGNVWEYTRDYAVADASVLPAVDPCQLVRADPDSQQRIVRGGSYASDSATCRSACRRTISQRESTAGYGCRLVIQL